jgi:hypothetical protein
VTVERIRLGESLQELPMSDSADSSVIDLEMRPHSSAGEWLRRWMPFVLSWDGILPCISPICTLAANAAPQGLVAVRVLAVLVPVGVALARAAIAQRQLDRVRVGERALLRPFVLAFAIVLLLFLEIGTSLLVLADAPLRFWGLAVIVYAAYFGCISYALRPSGTKVQK